MGEEHPSHPLSLVTDDTIQYHMVVEQNHPNDIQKQWSWSTGPRIFWGEQHHPTKQGPSYRLHQRKIDGRAKGLRLFTCKLVVTLNIILSSMRLE